MVLLEKNKSILLEILMLIVDNFLRYFQGRI